MPFNPDWIVPDWPAPAHVRAVFTTRAGGTSAAPWDSMNLGNHVGDAAEAVAANRAVLEGALGAQPFFLQQVHGVAAVDLDAPGVGSDGSGAPEADSASTAEPGRAAVVMVADCLPVLFTDRSGQRVGAAHAGWRGLAGGVLEQFLGHFMAFAQAERALDAIEIIAWLGPCIGPSAFEVGDEVRAAFVASDDAVAACFRPAATDGKWLADLPALARRRLVAAGIGGVYGNDGSDAWCTVSDASRFFSHRRDAGPLGSTGRMAACIWKA